jgi:hypothetical protein
MRLAILILAAMLITTAARANDCRVGTNMPMSDAVAQKPISADQPRITCTEGVIEARNRDGTQLQVKTWKFELKK